MDKSPPAPLQASDLLVILKLVAIGRPAAPVRLVAEALGLSKSAVALSVRRLETHGLLRGDGDARRVNKLALRECLESAIRWIAPAEVGGTEVGLLTAHAAPSLAARLIGAEDPVVIPLPSGSSRGRAVTPLHPLAPRAAARDAELYALLALVDAFRIGGARDREVASAELISTFARLIDHETVVRAEPGDMGSASSWRQGHMMPGCRPRRYRKTATAVYPRSNVDLRACR
jgi:DNA-binding Lrp family transcriptional regulator